MFVKIYTIDNIKELNDSPIDDKKQIIRSLSSSWFLFGKLSRLFIIFCSWDWYLDFFNFSLFESFFVYGVDVWSIEGKSNYVYIFD